MTRLGFAFRIMWKWRKNGARPWANFQFARNTLWFTTSRIGGGEGQ